MAKVNLPMGMTAIGEQAFSGCDGLTKIDFLPEGLTALGASCFSDCDALIEVNIPETITELPNRIFNGCTNLVKVNLPMGMTVIGESAFSNCDGLIKVDFLPEGISSLGSDAFYDCDGLISAVLPESLTTIHGRNVFKSCEKLTTIQFSTNLVAIGESTFESCKVLETVTLPATLQSIGSYAFRNCEKMAFNAQLPESLSSIGSYAFQNVRSQKEIIFPAKLKNLPDNLCEGCSALEKVIVSEGVTSIGSYTFRNALKLSDIKLPSTLTSIGSYAFENTAITNLDFLPEGLTSIEGSAFKGCNLDKVLRFPSTLTNLADYALSGLSSRVAAIYLPGTSGSVTVGNIFGIDKSKTSNCLIYTNGSVSTHSTLPNVITNNACLSLVLAEGTPFHCPEAFTAGKVTFKKQFNQGDHYYHNNVYTYNLYSTKGKASHWYGLSLPFAVTEITTDDGRTFAPFNSDVQGANPFWLRKATPSGFENVTYMEAGEPYIIAFPCNESYNDVYNVWGEVTFTGKGVTIPVTEDYQVSGEYYSMNRNYGLKEKSGSMYLLNSPRHGYYSSTSGSYDSEDPQGIRGNNSFGWGSRFVPSLRQSWAFEAYLSAGISQSYFSVSPESASRSVRALGAVPQIDDM